MEPDMVHLLLGGDGMEACSRCRREEPVGTMVRCGKCGGKWHPACTSGTQEPGPWHC